MESRVKKIEYMEEWWKQKQLSNEGMIKWKLKTCEGIKLQDCKTDLLNYRLTADGCGRLTARWVILCEWMNGWTGTDKRTDRRMDWGMDEWMDLNINEYKMNERMDGFTVKWI